ncbi:hypothetical protein J6590_001202 [Homalodisca vitripennis]|nr:hypothetical protein J6590_001202 [Homalodisca vitripennis]
MTAVSRSCWPACNQIFDVRLSQVVLVVIGNAGLNMAYKVTGEGYSAFFREEEDGREIEADDIDDGYTCLLCNTSYEKVPLRGLESDVISYKMAQDVMHRRRYQRSIDHYNPPVPPSCADSII